ncbi:EAL domain-containing protein [Rhodoferax sp. GW822-FHT02A01]|uniref:EAL domain-containing protein n=1 Tax=Rhodoferax sp. GW822-FHT02A01 TaxID=3141537 RepID=UPI00315CC666
MKTHERSSAGSLAALLAGLRARSLSVGIVVAMCIGLLVPAIIGGMLFAGLRQQKMAREAESHIVDKMGLLTSSLVDPVWNVDSKMIETIAAAALLDPQVVRITIRDQGVKPILNIERPERRLGEARVRSSELIRRGTVLGSVELEIDNGLQQREIASDRNANLTVLLGQFFLALVLILIAIRVRVLKPLSRLTAFSDQLAGGNLDLPLDWRQTDEIGRLAQQMDQMRRGLQTSFAEQRTILNNVEVGVLFVRNRIVLLANRYAEQMFGYASGTMGGMHIREVYLSEEHHADTARKIYEAIASSTGRYEGEQPLKRQDGTVFLARMRGCALDSAQPLEGSIWVFEDITEKRRAEEALSYSNSLTNAVLESTVDGILVVDREGKISRWNQKFVDLWRVPQVLLNTEVKDPVLDHVKSQVAQPEVFLEKVKELYDHPDASSEDTLLLLDGRVFERYSQPQRIGDTIVGRFWSFRDITGRKQSEEKLLLAASVFSHAREGIMITAADGTIMDVNDTFSRITGYDRSETLGRRPNMLKSGLHEQSFYAALWKDLNDKGHWYGELWNRRKNGEVYPEMLTISAVRDDVRNVTLHYVALFTDISAIKAHEKQLEHMAHFDVLTGLPNRVLLADRLHQAMVQTQRREQLLAVAYLDLDGFKAINDSHGHEIGDQVLIILAARMQQALREGDTLARLGGDEFVAVLLDLPDVSAGAPLLSRLLAAADAPLHVGEKVLQVSASIGVTFFPQAEEVDADQLLRQGDQAMYKAKQAGKNRYHIFDADQDRSLRGYHESLEHIRHSLALGEFVLHYQPKVNMRTGEVVGAEALIRWQHPQRGLLPPAVFLPLIEDHPLAVDVGEWVIESALIQVEIWRAQGLFIPVSVNVGARQLQQTDFVARLRESLARHPDIPAGSLEMEVLETSALEDLTRISRVIDACRDIGVMFALDDFGTGYSSLTYLKRLSVAYLKIDRSFVRDMLDDPDDLAILEGVIGLAQAFKRQVIAEGVETVEHGAALLKLGCELGQGFGIARPMPGADFSAWVANWRPDAAWTTRSLASDLLP